MRSSFYGVIAILLMVTCISFAVPEPSVVPGPSQWTLETKFTNPEQIVFGYNQDNKPIRYWYVIITLTNNTDKDVDFYPRSELVTDTFQIIPAGKGVGTKVFEQIKQRHKSQYPFLELFGKTDNKFLQGQDNTKDIAIIWSDFDNKANAISIFITGLSNETAVVEHPIEKENDEPKRVYLRKTLEIQYEVKGTPELANGVALEYKNKSWVMR